MSTKHVATWENLQYLVLAMTVAGQGLVGGLYLAAQAVWLLANVISLARDFVLQRPAADKVKDAGLCGLTVTLIVLRLTGVY